jgi:release factor glutamine methyltransferase
MQWGDLLRELADRLGATEGRFAFETATGRLPSATPWSLGGCADPAAVTRARAIAERVEGGEPLQHVLGTWGFRTLEVRVDARALVPRPETEVVVGTALECLGPVDSRPIALDLGTGSGVIACALVAEHRSVEVVAIDRSLPALALASENRAALPERCAARVHLLAGVWCAPLGPRLAGRVAVVVANPPYLSEEEWRSAPPTVRDWDPYDALVSGPTGTEAIAAVVGASRPLVAPGGALVIEIGAAQANAVRAIAASTGASSVEVEPDLAGRDRVAVVRW